jgi:hypothetical protein
VVAVPNRMTKLSETPAALAWIERFPEADRQLAIDLIDEVLLVSNDDFLAGLRQLVDQLAGPSTKLALYAERPIKKVFGRIPSFFPNSRTGRAEGPGVAPVQVDARDQKVGSEGLVANFITQFCRLNPSTNFSHPGPTKMRKEKIRKIAIVTDFIGSGDRIRAMLEAFRYVATLRSWRSYKLIEFCVAAYSGTTDGIAAVRSHRLNPDVRVYAGCPTISSAFSGQRKLAIERLCRDYPRDHRQPLGYDDNGALIAFAHGCPNNAPPILHSRASGWTPLFPGRTTSEFATAFLTKNPEDLDQRADNLLRIRAARKDLEGNQWISALLILAAAAQGLRRPLEISAHTHLPIDQVISLVSQAQRARWLSEQGHLTQLGRYELARLQKPRRRRPVLSQGADKFYYPTQLRAP